MKNDTKNIQPLGENVLVTIGKNEPKTKSGIVLPENSAQERPQEGIVMAVGDSKKIQVKKGQKVLFAKYSGTEIKIGQEEYLIVKNEDILAVIR